MTTARRGNGHDSGVRSRRTGHGLVIELTHEPTQNSLSICDFRDLTGQLRAADADHSVTYVIIRSATAGRHCAGFRLDSEAASSLADGTAAEASNAMMEALSATSCPTISIIDGPAIGAGCEIAVRCDLRVVTDNATFAIPAARHGFPYPAKSIAVLTQQSSKPAATALLLGETINATTAISLGIAQSHRGSASTDDIEQSLHRRFGPLPPTVTRYLMAAANHPNPHSDSTIAAAEREVRDSEAFKTTLANLKGQR